MKKILLLTLVVLLFYSVPILSQDVIHVDENGNAIEPTVTPQKVTSIPEVLGVKFTSSQKIIKAKYKTIKPLVEQPEGIAYSKPLVKLQNVESIFYQFYKGKLAKIMLVFDTSSIQPSAQEIVNNYYYYKDLLTKKYGEPLKSIENMPSAYDTDQYRHTGLASGQGEYNAMWQTENLSIILRLSGDEYKISSLLLYQYNPLSEQEDKEKEESAIDNI